MDSISGIAKSMLQLRAGMKTEDVSKEMEENITVSFMELMNQNNYSGNPQINSDTKLEIPSVSVDDAKSAYDATISSKKEVSVKKEAGIAEKKDEVSDTFDAYEEDVRDVLKEELGVTDEEIDRAMKSLGLDFFDLINTKNLTSLVQTLTGENIGTLFLSESFQNIMSEVSVLTDALCAELGITKEELLMLCEEWKEMRAAVEDGSIADKTRMLEKGAAVDAEANENAAEVNAKVSENKNIDAGSAEIESAESENADMTTAESESSSQENNQSFTGDSQNSNFNADNAGTAVVNHQTLQGGEFLVSQDNLQPYSNVNVADLIEQVAKNVRVHISTEMTSMEMQLNPEKLGKLYLNVSETEGVVRAQITVQTEAVKEALETQLVELRQTLNQQGVKVDAIEVTVAAHEFEQNLEGNTKQEEQMQQQMEETQKQTRRNLNLSELDGLAGLMSEEEMLMAQMMKDNGNQVDLTA